MKHFLMGCALLLGVSLQAEPYPLLKWGITQKTELLKVITVLKHNKSGLSKAKQIEPCQGAAVSNVIVITVKNCNEIAVENRSTSQKDEKIIQ